MEKMEMLERKFCFSRQELMEVRAALTLAEQLGWIESSALEDVDKRRICKNEEIKRKLKLGEKVYGMTYYSLPAYLQHELTSFKLDFVSEAETIREKYSYRTMNETEKKAFYEQNSDLFTRYCGDAFPYEDVKSIIEKRLREEEYDALIKKLLCQLP